MTGQGGQMRQRVLRGLIPECGDLPFRGLGGHAGGQPDAGRDGFQQWLIEQLRVQAQDPPVLSLELMAQHT